MIKRTRHIYKYKTTDGNVVLADVPCPICLYNIKSIELDGHCPECGFSIRDGVDSVSCHMSYEGLVRVRSGTVWYALGLLVAALAVPLAYIGEISYGSLADLILAAPLCLILSTLFIIRAVWKFSTLPVSPHGYPYMEIRIGSFILAAIYLGILGGLLYIDWDGWNYVLRTDIFEIVKLSAEDNFYYYSIFVMMSHLVMAIYVILLAIELAKIMTWIIMFYESLCIVRRFMWPRICTASLFLAMLSLSASVIWLGVCRTYFLAEKSQYAYMASYFNTMSYIWFYASYLSLAIALFYLGNIAKRYIKFYHFYYPEDKEVRKAM